MQENKTIRKRTELRQRGLSVACMLLATAALTGCDEQPSPSSAPRAVDDSAAAYAALSATLEQCDSAHDACVEADGASTAAIERCRLDLESCRTQAKPAEETAETTLDREAHWCHKVCTDEDAGPGGVDDADGGSGDWHECIAEHAPKLPKCLKGLFSCLDEAGVFERDASRREIRSCVRETHGCIKDRLAELREKHHGWHDRAGAEAAGAGGAATAGSGGGSAGASGTAGSGGDDAAAPSGSEQGRHGRKHKHKWLPFWKR